MGASLGIVKGVGAGAALMYLLDPIDGRRRRHLLYDRVRAKVRRCQLTFEKGYRDGRHRIQGARVEAVERIRGEHVDDERLVARVRARLGRLVSHPHAVRVTAQDGRVTLEGPVLAREVKRLLSGVARVRGVQGVESRLDVHEQPDDVPALQGGVERPGARGEEGQRSWPPSLRVAATAGGTALVAYGLARRGPGGLLAGIAGAGLAGRGLANRPLRTLVGLHDGPGLVRVVKTLEIDAPPAQVFDLWTAYENFPLFMSHLREVRDLGDGRSRWTVEGPAGVPVSWEAELTRLEPGRALAWCSRPGSAVETEGRIFLEPVAEGRGTRVHVQLSYDPPAGALGHVAALLFGADPKSRMDEDPLRMKSCVETGRLPHDAAAAPERWEAPRP